MQYFLSRPHKRRNHAPFFLYMATSLSLEFDILPGCTRRQKSIKIPSSIFLIIEDDRDVFIQVNSFGHVETFGSPNPYFFPG